MITKMKKLTFLIYHKEYEQFLQDIRNLGVIHIAERQTGEMDENLQAFMQKRASYKSLLFSMFSLADKQVDEALHTEESADVLWQRFDRLQARLQELKQRLVVLEKSMLSMEVWGDFDWNTIGELAKNGWYVQFYTCQDKEYDESWEERYNAITIKKTGKSVYFVTVTSAPARLDIEQVKLPEFSLSELKGKCVETQREISCAEDELKTFCHIYYRTMEYYNSSMQGEIDLLQVKLNSERMAEGSVMLLEGWIPEENEAEVRNLLEKSGVYYEIRNANRNDNAPIKLKNNAFTRMYEVLVRMYGMPDYAEFDPTPLVAPFFTLFFGFCMGDAGYGVILVLLGFFLKKKLSVSLAGMMNLVITLGIATTVIGAVLGTFFGVSLFDLDLPDSVKQFMVVGKIGDTGYDKQMLLALLIGVVHICIAMAVKAISSAVRYGFKESLSAWGWLLLVVGFVCTGGLSFFEVISKEVSTWAFIVIGSVSAIGIYLLNDLHRNVFVNIGAGLWDTYNMATGLMGDILSYIRLYALGLAGGMLGGVFNQLAFMVNDAVGPSLGWLFCGLILVFGHALNIAMSCLSAFVHPLRLTFVEYFKNSGYDGKGKAYNPFSVVKNK
ncbi:V-type ATPase 116kDa subunit family protein [Phocaeicola sp.]|uniref:V-type ATP synthase subunit I n=1 Tax=Phocaeicola sp. TaxID=2773926 RepID=UPI0023D37DAD|nr:V-type ATPase 116kDa subunit family protein [Phocaeicola sp.]MDE5677552.1 ATPase V [Phocaeicola sp.]